MLVSKIEGEPRPQLAQHTDDPDVAGATANPKDFKGMAGLRLVASV